MKKMVADLTVEELRVMIEAIVDDSFAEWLGDPDEGLEVKAETIKRLEESMKSILAGQKSIPPKKLTKKRIIKAKE